jgi:hypothetical protein
LKGGSLRAVAEVRKRLDEMTEEDIRRHMREDEADPEEETPVDTRSSVPVTLVRERLRMSHAGLAGPARFASRGLTPGIDAARRGERCSSATYRWSMVNQS